MFDLHKELEKLSSCKNPVNDKLTEMQRDDELKDKEWWRLVNQSGEVVSRAYKTKWDAEKYARKHGLTHVRARMFVELAEDYQVPLKNNRWERGKTHSPLDIRKKEKAQACEIGGAEPAPEGAFWVEDKKRERANVAKTVKKTAVSDMLKIIGGF